MCCSSLILKLGKITIIIWVLKVESRNCEDQILTLKFIYVTKKYLLLVLYHLFNISHLLMKDKNILNELLLSWEDTYKKGQLTLWIFLSLKESPKYVDEIRRFIAEKSNGTMSCEEQSLYRILRKFEHIDVLEYETKKGNKGPERKYYRLTPLGNTLFEKFVERNINLFYNKEIRNLLNISL